MSASENRQNRVSHGESVRVGSSGPEYGLCSMGCVPCQGLPTKGDSRVQS